MVTGGGLSLGDFSSSASAAFEVDALQRGECRSEDDAQLSARLSVELCSPGCGIIPH